MNIRIILRGTKVHFFPQVLMCRPPPSSNEGLNSSKVELIPHRHSVPRWVYWKNNQHPKSSAENKWAGLGVRGGERRAGMAGSYTTHHILGKKFSTGIREQPWSGNGFYINGTLASALLGSDGSKRAQHSQQKKISLLSLTPLYRGTN